MLSFNLDLNKQPSSQVNKSFTNAFNVVISDDGSIIRNERGIGVNNYIDNAINKYFNSEGSNYKIIGNIPCSNEFILFVVNLQNQKNLHIFRFKEVNDDIKLVSTFSNAKYYGGYIKGAYTYNKNNLIITFSEITDNLNIPLRTVNLGSDDIIDYDLKDYKLYLSPEVIIPKVTNLNYITGSSFKGWVHLYIRFKIDKYNYTKWYNFHRPIFIDKYTDQQILKYIHYKTYNRDGMSDNISAFAEGFVDNISDNNETINRSFEFDINFDNNRSYDYYQIASVTVTKKYSKCYKTNDIKINNDKTNGIYSVNSYSYNIKDMEEYDISNIIKFNDNYFNVKNIINYNNRLYISNYKETEGNVSVSNDIINKIKPNLIYEELNKNDIKRNCVLFDSVRTSSNYIFEDDGISFEQYIKADKNELVTLDIYTDRNKYLENDSKEAYTTNIKNLKIKVDYSKKQLISQEHEGFIIKLRSNIYDYGIKIETLDGEITSGFIKITYTNSITGIESISVLDIDLTRICIANNYIDNSTDFNVKTNTCLTPGEIYNFYIHYVDKYGNATNGIRLNNNIVLKGEDSNLEVIPMSCYYDNSHYYVAIPINEKVSETYSNKGINIKAYRGIDVTNKQNPILINRDINNEKHVINKILKENKQFNSIKDLYWYQISNVGNVDFPIPFINSNNERLFKIPNYRYLDYITDEDYINIQKDVNIPIYKVTSEKAILPKIIFDNIEIPKDYVGYFISYEEVEQSVKHTGVLTKSDFRIFDRTKYRRLNESNILGLYDDDIDVANDNNRFSKKMLFYSSNFDIYDKIDLDVNVLRIEGESILDVDLDDRDIFTLYDSSRNSYSLNLPEIRHGYNIQKLLPIDDFKILIADSANDNRIGLGTALMIDDKNNLFPNYKPNRKNSDANKIYKCSLINISRDIYTKTNKKLIRLTDIIYRHDTPTEIKNGNVNNYTYPSFFTNDGIIIFNGFGALYDDTEKVYTTNSGITYYSKEYLKNKSEKYFLNTIPFLRYIQIGYIDSIHKESKNIKSKLKNEFFTNKDATTKIAVGNIIRPKDTLDLFENINLSVYDTVLTHYTNYKNNIIYNNTYNKTIRRSNIMSDESDQNKWRHFPIEGYKHISENKGDITNICAIGTMFLIHTEHSLFMLDTNNKLETINESIQLTQPDAFDVNYKEVFTSNMGFAGLKDSDAAIIDDFGYIFYDNDSNHFYRFDDGKLIDIDKDIINYIKLIKPFDVRFINDKKFNRVIIKFKYINAENKLQIMVLSYNYKTNNFISQHFYNYSRGFSTKNNAYILFGDKTKNKVYTFNDRYGIYENSHKPDKYHFMGINVMINFEYEVLKKLIYLRYKLRRLSYENKDYKSYKHIDPLYAGDFIRVYNDYLDTGNINILLSGLNEKDVINKPRLVYGNWHFNYLADMINSKKQEEDARVFNDLIGNYFIVKIKCSNASGKVIEIEDIQAVCQNVQNEW